MALTRKKLLKILIIALLIALIAFGALFTALHFIKKDKVQYSIFNNIALIDTAAYPNDIKTITKSLTDNSNSMHLQASSYFYFLTIANDYANILYNNNLPYFVSLKISYTNSSNLKDLIKSLNQKKETLNIEANKLAEKIENNHPFSQILEKFYTSFLPSYKAYVNSAVALSINMENILTDTGLNKPADVSEMIKLTEMFYTVINDYLADSLSATAFMNTNAAALTDIIAGNTSVIKDMLNNFGLKMIKDSDYIANYTAFNRDYSEFISEKNRSVDEINLMIIKCIDLKAKILGFSV